MLASVFRGEALANVMTGADTTCPAVFRTMLTVVARGASMAGKRTCARCTESGAGEHSGDRNEENSFHAHYDHPLLAKKASAEI